jgi:hypothetical protein
VLVVETNVGVVNAAVLVVIGYMGTKYWLSVAVAKRPISFFAPMAEVAAALAAAELEFEEFLLARLPKTPPKTAPAITTTATGMAIFTHLLTVFLGARAGVMYPDDSL